jgi:hypothetical protein
VGDTLGWIAANAAPTSTILFDYTYDAMIQMAKDMALGEFFRRMRRKLGAAEAVTAAGHKLARILYHVLRTKEAYNESVFLRHDQEAIKRAEDRLRKQAAKLGFRIVPNQLSQA